jgi:hypothetical protein
MKTTSYIIVLIAFIINSCHTSTKVIPVDMDEYKKAVTSVLDAHWAAVKAKDADL